MLFTGRQIRSRKYFFFINRYCPKCYSIYIIDGEAGAIIHLVTSVCPSARVCETYIVHYLNGTGLRSAPPTCIVHYWPVLCTMAHKGDLWECLTLGSRLVTHCECTIRCCQSSWVCETISMVTHLKGSITSVRLSIPRVSDRSVAIDQIFNLINPSGECVIQIVKF